MKMVKIIGMSFLLAIMVMPVWGQETKKDAEKTPSQVETVVKQTSDADNEKPVMKDRDQALEKKAGDVQKMQPGKDTTPNKGVKKYRGNVQRMDSHTLQTDDYKQDLEKKRQRINRMGVEKLERQSKQEGTQKDAEKEKKQSEEIKTKKR